MIDLFSKSLSLALSGALVFQSAGPAFAAGAPSADASTAVSARLEALKKDAQLKDFWAQFAFEDEYMLGRLDAAGYKIFEDELAPVAAKWKAGDAAPGSQFAVKWKEGMRKNAMALALAMNKRNLVKTFSADELESLKRFEKARPDRFGKFGAEYAKHKMSIGSTKNDAAAKAAKEFVVEWRNRLKVELNEYGKTKVAPPAKPDALAKAFPDEKERAMVRCFSGTAVFEGVLDSVKLRSDTALAVQKKLLAPTGKPEAGECGKLSADELKAYYCRFEPKTEGTPSDDLKKLQAQCGDKRFEAAFPDPMARAVLQCLDPSKASFLGSEAKIKESFAAAVTAAKLSLDKTAKDKLGYAFKDKKDEERAMKCVKDADKNDALLDFYCANEPKGPDIGPKTQLASKCAERQAAKLFADPADYAVYQCLGPKTLPADLQKDPAKKESLLKAWGTGAAGKAQMVLTGSVDSAKLGKQEKDCLLGKGLGKDKLRDFYCRYQPAETEQRPTATGAMDQGKVADQLSQGPGETVEFDNSGRKQATTVAAGGKPPPLQELNNYCGEQRRAAERNRPIPGRGLTINEPGAGPASRDLAKQAEDEKKKELMANLKKDAIGGAFGAAGFGILGFIFGGPIGAVVGAMIGFALMGAVTHLNNNPPK